MRRVRIVNVTRGAELASRAEIADRFFPRLRGLLGRKSLSPGDGLVITPCASVHGAFMRFAIDVLFLGRDGKVLHTMRLARWGVSPIVRGSRQAIELPEGTLLGTGTMRGDVVNVLTQDL